MPQVVSFLINPFEVSMEQSYIKATIISAFTQAALAQQASDPAIGPLHTFYTPLHTALTTAYTAWKAQAGSAKGQTQSLKTLLQNLSSTVIDEWDFAVQQEYRKGTPTYLQIFPEGRAPFQSGKQEDRILAVGALADALGAEGSFPTLKQQVDTYYYQLSTTNAGQKGAKSDTGLHSEAVATAAEACAAGLFYVYGGLVQKYYTQPETIENYFDVSLIREKEQRAFTGTVPAGTTKSIAKRTLEPDAQIRIVNSGPTRLRFFLAEEKNDEPTTGVTILPGEDQTIPASQLGTGPYLGVMNEGTEGAGSYELVLL